MQLTGKHILSASPSQIWNLLMNPDTLAKITPGISKLEQTGDYTFNALSEVKIGPVKGTFNGVVEIVNPEEPKHFSLTATQKSKIGNVTSEVKINLVPLSDNQTEVNFFGDAKLSGLLARTGQRVMSSLANSLVNQFFTSLEEEIKNIAATN